MSFGGSSGSTTTQVKFNPQQRELINSALPTATNFAQSGGVQLPDFSTIPGFNSIQQQGQQLGIDAALGDLSNLASSGIGASSFLLDPANLDPASNPFLQGTIDAAIRPLTQQFTESVLPGIRGEAITAGQLGGSRQGVAEGIASRGFTDAIGDVTSGIAGQNFQQAQNRMLQALGLLPQTQSAVLAPSATLESIGGTQFGLEAAQLQEQYQRELQEQLAPYLAAKDVIGLATGLGAGTSTTTSGGSPGLIGGGLGGAATGASIGSIIPGIGTGIGAGVGGIFGALSSLF